MEPEAERQAQLLTAQAKAVKLFEQVQRRGVIAPGVTELAASDAIHELAAEMFGLKDHWHKRIVRAGPNTLEPYRQDPPDRVIAEDDIVFLDFGPVFDGWEADFGRTFVLGHDEAKHRLCDALPEVWHAGRDVFETDLDITGEQLYAVVCEIAGQAGWEFGGTIAGHLVGQFPHETIAGDSVESYIAPGSTGPMRRLDRNGTPCHWILEVHLVDRERQIGGFVEELLDVRQPSPAQ